MSTYPCEIMDIILTLGFLLIFLNFEQLGNSNRNSKKICNNWTIEKVECKNRDINISDNNTMDVNNVDIESVEGKSIDCDNMHKNNMKNSNMERNGIENTMDNKIMDIDSMKSDSLDSNKKCIIASNLNHCESSYQRTSNHNNKSNAMTNNDTADVIDSNVLKVVNRKNLYSILKIPQTSMVPRKSMIFKDGSLTIRQIVERNSEEKIITLISVLQILKFLLTISKVISLQYRLCELPTSKPYFHTKINLKISAHDLPYLGHKDTSLRTLYLNTAVNEANDKMSDSLFDKQEDFKHFQWIFEPNRRFPAVFCRNFTAFPAIQQVLSRLASFRSIVKDLTSTPLSANRLSQSGFGYNGTGTTVTCEECGKVVELSSFIRGYDMADPSDTRFHNHGCSYVANVDSRMDIMTDSAPSNPNIVQDKRTIFLSVTFPSISSKHLDNGLTATPVKEQESNILSGDNTSNIDALEGSFDRQQYPETSLNSGIFQPPVPDYSRQLNATSEQACEGNASGGQGQVDSGQTSDKDTEQTTLFKVLSQPTYPTYIAYQKRLESFALWLFYHIATPMFLARAGFFYAGYADCVRCFQCGLGLRSWKVGDNVYDEHKKHRPQCPFLQAQVMAGVPTTETVHQTARPISEVNSPVLPSNNTERLSMPLTQQSVMIPAQQTFVSYSPSDQPTNSSIAPQDTSQSSSQKSLKLKLLQDENTKLQEQQLCKVCFLAPCRDLFLPCGDLYACADCSKLLTHCPLCSKQILATVTTYLT